MDVFDGLGDMTGLISEWNTVFIAFSNTAVNQDEYLGNPTVLTVEDGNLVIDFGT